MHSKVSEHVAPTGIKDQPPVWHIECRCQYGKPEGEERAICGHPLIGIDAVGFVPLPDRCVVCVHVDKCPFCGAPR